MTSNSFHTVCDLYCDTRRMNAWMIEEVEQAQSVVGLFVEAISTLQSALSRSQTASLLWQFYLRNIAFSGQPLYVAEVYHKELVTLQWNTFVPTKEDMDNIIRVGATLSSCSHSTDQAILHQIATPLFSH